MKRENCDCRIFIDHLDRYLDDRLSPEERREIDEHIADCPECARLLELTTGDLTMQTADEKEALTGAILAGTSGSACGRSHAMLADSIDNTLDAGDRELLDRHMEHCGGCRELAGTLAWLAPQLREMAEVSPDARFTADVVSVTSARNRSRFAWVDQVREWGREWVETPMFSWQAAYVGAVLIVVTIGNPFACLKEGSTRVANAFQMNTMIQIADITQPYFSLKEQVLGFGKAELNETEERASSVRATVTDEVRRKKKTAATHFDPLRQHGAGFIQAVAKRDMEEAVIHFGEIQNDLEILWSALRGHSAKERVHYGSAGG